MRALFEKMGVMGILMMLMTQCVHSYDPSISTTVNVLVVDGVITDLPEKQVVQLSRSQADPKTGEFGSSPVTGAQIEVVRDSTVIIVLRETDLGHYQFPDGFKGQVGHAYQLRFQLPNGTRYQSSTEIMQPVPTISRVYDRFNATSLSAEQLMGFRAANDLYLETNDPAETQNFYRWDWKLWERQEWCRSCGRGRYFERDPTNQLLEDCIPEKEYPYPFADYECRTKCWEILYGVGINVFSDVYTNGGQITGRLVAQIPFYQHHPCLVEIRQSSLTQAAYRYFKRLQDQTQTTGGLADTPPAAPIGNVQNMADEKENVVGYFSASSVATLQYWLDRKNTVGDPPKLFQALNGRGPVLELTFGVRGRPPLAVCVPSDSRTPNQPVGWKD